MDDDAEDDLAAAAAELAASLEALRDDLAPRGPLGLPRPPRPAEVLRFAEGHALPTVIAILEANVRALELLRAALRLADPERSVREEVAPGDGESAAARAGAVGRETLRRADEALGELLSAVEGGALPPEAEASGVVEDARRLREAVEARLAELESRDEAGSGGGTEPGGGTGSGGASAPEDGSPLAGDGALGESGADGPGATVDVEAELESIKAEVGEDEGGTSEGAGTGEESETDEPADAATDGNDADAAPDGDDATADDGRDDGDAASGDDAPADTDGDVPSEDDGEAA